SRRWYSDDEPKAIKPSLICVYKVDLETGKEELIRSVEMDISLGSLKRLLGVSAEEYIYNTVLTSSKHRNNWWEDNPWNLNGVPATFIVPGAILFEELELSKLKRAVTNIPPVVETPIN
ncbi:MAG: hypothetical protein KJ607_13960, partial [Bacteroidetes bacterium]|nr:hypothetical protein [Bacteroidota bacterium]